MSSTGMTRRELVAASAATAIAASAIPAAVSAFAEEAPAEESGTEDGEPPATNVGGFFGDFTREQTARAKYNQVVRDTLPSFMSVGDPITEFADELTFDVVVVGAGASGLSAAMSASDAGAKVACLQKEETGSSQGYEACGLDLDRTDEAGVAAVTSAIIAGHDYRPNRSLVEVWARNSGEAVKWLCDKCEAAGVPSDVDPEGQEVLYNGYPVRLIWAGPQGTFAGAAPALAEYAASQGVEMFYATPAVQLVKEDGRVTAVIGKTPAGDYVKFNATKGIILATGDYQSNEDMVAYYCPDSLGFPNLQMNRTGDGHKMGIAAGGRLEPIGHTKMIHDGWSTSAPFLMVDDQGKRFMDENMDWELVSCMIRDRIQTVLDPAQANLFSIVDANFKKQVEQWAQVKPGLTVRDIPPYYSHEANTIEELAEMVGIDPATLQATVDRYNELVELGADLDFGKDARFLAPIVEPPFNAVGRDYWWGMSAIIGGLVVDADNEVLDDDDNPIPGLYAVGNVSGPFYGAPDYHFVVTALSLGRCVTGGYVCGRHVAGL